MSLFWQNFNSNGNVRLQAIRDLHETLAEVCEGFAVRDYLPRWQRRQTLLAELKRLADYYRGAQAWEGLD